MEKACRVIRNSDTYEGKQGLTYASGISKESAGADAICLHSLTLPAGGRATAHYHAGHETAIFVLSGHPEHIWGDRLENHDRMCPGDYVYIPAGVPHVVMNRTTDPVVAILARTDPNEQESTVLTPELEGIVDAFLAA